MECPQTPRRWPAAVAAAAVAVGVLGLGAAAPALAVPSYAQAVVAISTNPLTDADAVAVSPDGSRAYVLDGAAGKVFTVSSTGSLLATTTLTGVSNPQGLALGGGALYVADTDNHRVGSIAVPTGTASVALTPEAGSTTAGGAPQPGTATASPLRNPTGLAWDPATSALYIADTGNNQVEKVVSGVLSVVAGTGVAGSGSSGSGATTQLNAPRAVAVGASSTRAGADTGNGSVLAVSPSGAVTPAASTPSPDALVVTGSGDVLAASSTAVSAVSGSSSTAVSSGGLRDVSGLAVSTSGVVWVADAAGTSSAVLTLTPPAPAAAPVRITSTPPTTAAKGAPLTRTFTATGTPTITWSFVGGAAPACLGAGAVGATTGVLTGTPATAGTCTFTVRADNGTTHDDQLVSLSVGSVPATLTAKPAATAGQGSATVTWTAPTASAAAAEAVTGYVVTPTAGGAAGTPRSVAAGSLSTTFTGLKAGTAYTFTVAATNAFGTAAASPASAAVTPYGGIAAPGPGLTRYQGGNRVTTAVRVSQQLFPDAGSARAVVVASSTSYADSLAGARLAAAVRAPLLLTDPLALNPEVAAEVGRVLAVPATTTTTTSAASSALAAAHAGTTAAKPTATGTVYLLGGTSAVSAAAETALKAVSSKYTVTRLSGADRYETAVKIAAQTAVDDPVPGAPIYVASGANYPDGLAVAALASRTGGVVLLTQGPTMPAATLTYLQTYDPNSELLVAVGGPAAAATTGHGGERAIVGADRYDTARLVAARFTAAPGSARVDDVGLATGTNWPDALAGAAAMGNLDGPLLLTTPDALSPAVGSALTALSKSGRPTSALVFGGATVVSPSTADAFAAQVAG